MPHSLDPSGLVRIIIFIYLFIVEKFMEETRQAKENIEDDKGAIEMQMKKERQRRNHRRNMSGGSIKI